MDCIIRNKRPDAKPKNEAKEEQRLSKYIYLPLNTDVNKILLITKSCLVNTRRNKVFVEALRNYTIYSYGR